LLNLWAAYYYLNNIREGMVQKKEGFSLFVRELFKKSVLNVLNITFIKIATDSASPCRKITWFDTKYQ